MAIETITLAGDCFRCVEAVYEQVEGVLSVESGARCGASSSVRHPRFAIAKRCPPCRRTLPTRPSTAIRRSQPSPTRGSACGLRWRFQSARPAALSIGTLCAARTRCLRRPAAPVWPAGRHQACERIACSATARAAAPAAPPAARTDPLPPTTQLAWPRHHSVAASAAARIGSLPIYGSILNVGFAASISLNRPTAMGLCENCSIAPELGHLSNFTLDSA